MKTKTFILTIAFSLILTSFHTISRDNPGTTIQTRPFHNSNSIRTALRNMISRMTHINLTGNADYDLAASMKEHHKGAIAMATIELSYGNDRELRKMAARIIAAEEKEIKSLDNIAAKHKIDAIYSKAPAQNELNRAIANNMAQIIKIPAMKSTIDHEFASLMIKQYQDGINIRKTIFAYAKDPMFIVMTKKVLNSQEKDINELKAWLSSKEKIATFTRSK